MPSLSGVPAVLQPILLNLLAPDVANRYQTAGQALEDLERVRRHAGSKRLPLGAWLAGTAALVAVVIGVVAMWGRLAPQRRPPASSEWVRLTNLPDSASQPALSRDGRLLAFIRGPGTFITSGQIYVKTLPDGDPVQLTRDATSKMSPVFSPDGSRIAYTVTTGQQWNTWVLPVIGGQPHLWLTNASGLSWFDGGRLLFSEVKDGDIYMAVVASDENRANVRDVYPAARHA